MPACQLSHLQPTPMVKMLCWIPPVFWSSPSSPKPYKMLNRKVVPPEREKDQFTRSPDKTNLSGTTSKPTTPSAPRASNSSSHNSRGFQKR
ncbi:hypothetical protein G6F51_014183 [Rhizopus arrhizus]|uniref:Uncharacterized protein n=1 Tax=Rhizopus oryzae TaxID=64495 RepID=A0A9P7BZB1_RHIOR|nr:hypothetical protein G6F51_014183 [Rhizopus arrhizus]